MIKEVSWHGVGKYTNMVLGNESAIFDMAPFQGVLLYRVRATTPGGLAIRDPLQGVWQSGTHSRGSWSEGSTLCVYSVTCTYYAFCSGQNIIHSLVSLSWFWYHPRNSDFVKPITVWYHDLLESFGIHSLIPVKFLQSWSVSIQLHECKVISHPVFMRYNFSLSHTLSFPGSLPPSPPFIHLFSP